MEIRKEKLNICKNLFALLIGIMIMVIGKQPTIDLQSSYNLDGGLGTISASVGQGASILFLLLWPPLLISKVGPKNAVVIGYVFETLYIAANLYPKWWTLIPANVLSYGFNNVGRVAQNMILVHYSIRMRGCFGVSFEKALGICSGLMTSLAALGSTIGNVISFELLNAGANLNLNESRESRQNCGVYFDENPAEHHSENFKQPSDLTIYILFGVLTSFGLLSLFLIWFMMDATTSKCEKVKVGLFLKVIRLNRDWRAIALFMVNFNRGVTEAFVTSEFNKAFVTCILGMQYVGLSSICYGMSKVIFGFTSGILSKRLGRFPVFVFAMAVELTTLLHAILWNPGLKNDSLNVYLLIILWGISFATLTTLSLVLHGILHADQIEATYANFLIAESCGQMVCNGFSSSLPLTVQVYVIIAVLVASSACYYKLERSMTPESLMNSEISSDTSTQLPCQN